MEETKLKIIKNKINSASMIEKIYAVKNQTMETISVNNNFQVK